MFNHLGDQEESQYGIQNATKQSNCIINVWNNFIEGGGVKVADLNNWEMSRYIILKAKGTVHSW